MIDLTQAFSGKIRRTVKEDAMHIAVVRVLEKLEMAGELTFNHSPNEGKRTKNHLFKLLRMGMKPGHPDLDIWTRHGEYMAIELKTLNGSTTAKQNERHKQLIKLGFPVHVLYCSSTTAAQKQVMNILRHAGVNT